MEQSEWLKKIEERLEQEESGAKTYRSGYVVVVGKPNVGKSTLINKLVGNKVSIVSSKPQTTRRRVLGILTNERAQIVFVDTPGIITPKNKLNKYMMANAENAVPDADLAIFLCDATRMPDELDKKTAQILKRNPNLPVLLVLNKMDKIEPERIEMHTNAYWKLIEHYDWIATCARRGTNVDNLLSKLIFKLPESPALFPEDQYTDQSSRVLVSELIREKVLIKTRQEVPHGTAVIVENWEERDNGLLYIAATIYVEKKGQKPIIIGDGGSMLKALGEMSRVEIEEIFERKVFLDLWVKVKEDWRQDAHALRSLDFIIDK